MGKEKKADGILIAELKEKQSKFGKYYEGTTYEGGARVVMTKRKDKKTGLYIWQFRMFT